MVQEAFPLALQSSLSTSSTDFLPADLFAASDYHRERQFTVSSLQILPPVITVGFFVRVNIRSEKQTTR